MKLSSLCLALLASTSIACQAGPSIVSTDAAQRQELFSAIKSMEGRWQGPSPDGTIKYTEFKVSSAGSVVRETMLPGEEHEMTNMYSLDGNSVVMTHYCAGGNQPRMRASSIREGRMDFLSEGVQDLKAKDELYMGAMRLVFVDADHIEQHWSALKDGELEHEMVIEMTRVK